MTLPISMVHDQWRLSRAHQRLHAGSRCWFPQIQASTPHCRRAPGSGRGPAFTTDLLVDLVHEWLATATPETVHAGKRPIEVVRARITDAGRLALAG
jgi:hypothetical protein